MSAIHNDVLRRVPCILGSLNQEARLHWNEATLNFDEIRDIEAAERKFLIVYEKLLYSLFQLYNTRLTRIAIP